MPHVPNGRKHGGKYRTVSGAVKNISPAAGTMTMESGETIPINNRHPRRLDIRRVSQSTLYRTKRKKSKAKDMIVCFGKGFRWDKSFG